MAEDKDVPKSEVASDTPAAWNEELASNIARNSKTWDSQYREPPPLTAKEAFSLCFDDEVIEVLVKEANRYAK